MRKPESTADQALRIAQSLPIPNACANRIAEELAAGFTEEQVVACVTQGYWPSSLKQRLRPEPVGSAM